MTTNRPPKPTFKLVLQAEPDHEGYDPDGTTRLKRALKRLLRGFGLKCLRVEPHQERGLAAEAQPDNYHPGGG